MFLCSDQIAFYSLLVNADNSFHAVQAYAATYFSAFFELVEDSSFSNKLKAENRLQYLGGRRHSESSSTERTGVRQC